MAASEFTLDLDLNLTGSESLNIDLGNPVVPIGQLNHQLKIYDGKDALSDGSSADIYINFHDGCSFRYLIQFLSKCSNYGHFIFSPDTIKFIESSEDNLVINKFVIKGKELVNYSYSAEEEVSIFKFTMNAIETVFKSFNKNGGIMIKKISGNPKLYFGKVEATNSEGHSYVTALRADKMTIYEIHNFKKGRYDYNCILALKDLCTCFTTMSAFKKNINITGYQTYISIEVCSGADAAGRFKEFGEKPIRDNMTDEEYEKAITPICSYRYPYTMIKNLSKLSGISERGTVKIYIEDGSPIKLLINIGTYGELEIYLKNVWIT